MDVYEITGYATGVSDAGVNYLQPEDAFQDIINGYIYRQVLQSRQGVGYFAPRLAGETRVFGIFEHTLPDSTKELLAVDQNFLYKFNTGTGIFDQIPFAGSMAGYAGFNISAKDLYVSGTSYPTSANVARFVFCGEGISPNGAGSAIFFYNGTDVRDFTSAVDNTNYAAPTSGVLTSATYVLWFNERLNFVIPVIAGIDYNQGVLYSGIRTVSGNGDKFNVAGSGLFQADTYQNITGATILGQIMVLNFDRMAYTLEKRGDAFNPYFGRAIPGVLGTNAKFSAVSWNEAVRSIGKTGILATDGRQNLRVDNKIPNFTRDEIAQIDFNLTYGGFDRINNQFLWAYKESESDGETQNKVLVGNYEENTWSIYDQRFSVFGQTDIGLNLTWDDIDETTGNESWAEWDTTEEIWDRIGLGESVQKTLAGDDLGFIYELNQDFDDYFTNITAITTGTTTTLTVSETGVLTGDLITISNVGGMIELNNFDPDTNEQTGNLYEVISSTPTSIEINVDSTLFTAYTTGGSLSKVISFSARTIPFNPYRSQGRRCYISHVEFLIDTNGGSLKVDVYSDQQTSPFKQNVLCMPSLTNQAAEWITMTVNQEANFLTFVLKQESPAVQLRLTNMRIHCQQGGLTSG
jgi:hypothetical protein